MGILGLGYGYKALKVAKRNKASADIFKKSKIASKKTPDKSKLDLAQSELNIAEAKGKSVDKMAKDVKENTELFRQGSAFKKGVGKFGFNKPSGKK
jgi:arylamine N-acetyltransferase